MWSSCVQKGTGLNWYGGFLAFLGWGGTDHDSTKMKITQAMTQHACMMACMMYLVYVFNIHWIISRSLQAVANS